MLRIPSSSRKRYLTGMDWMIHLLDGMTRRATGVGNTSQIVLELNGPLAPERLRERLAEFLRRYPVVRGRAARDYSLCPYWRIPRRHDGSLPRIDVVRIDDSARFDEALAALQDGVNQPLGGRRDYLAFRAVEAGDKAYLAMAFDHRLLDAGGAEAFLGLFQHELETGTDGSDDVSLTQPAGLCDWARKFRAGRQVNRALLALSENSVRCVPLPATLMGRPYRFKVIRFDDEQSERILATAYDRAGYLMFMPYALAAGVQAFGRVFDRHGVEPGDIVVPVSLDTRSPGTAPGQVFFNHMSFLLFKVATDEAVDFAAVLNTVKRQMYQQVKSGLPQDICHASDLMRIAPLGLLSRLARLPMKGRVASFCFAHIGESAYGSDEFMGQRVGNLFHMPRAPVPPGVGLFFNHFHGMLNATLSYIDGTLTDDDVATIAEQMTAHLIEGASL